MAIYDPFAAGGAAGSRETVQKALSSSMTVVAILVRPGAKEAHLAIYTPKEPPPLLPDDEWNNAKPPAEGDALGTLDKTRHSAPCHFPTWIRDTTRLPITRKSARSHWQRPSSG